SAALEPFSYATQVVIHRREISVRRRIVQKQGECFAAPLDALIKFGISLGKRVAGTFAPTGSLATARQYFALMPFGGVLVAAGGLTGTTRLSSAEQYQGASFATAGSMTTVRAAHTATVLNDGSVLVTGGQGSTGASVATAERLQ